MATINIQITASTAAFNNFADGLGYQEKVPKTQEELALLTEPIAIEDMLKTNPQSKTDFLLEYLKTITVNKLAEQQTNAIANATRASVEAEKQAVKDSIANAITVTFA